MQPELNFLARLYAEQRLHKEHRFKFVIYQLSFVTALLGSGTLVVFDLSGANYCTLLRYIHIRRRSQS